ncbi:hypothetical protein C7M84_016169 [Penaeus vannamei]|uniref:Uncharacterized protein n=1 Tax=Penaeus vannamei TaxID=6689 RepID=A0A3R7NSW5_PENVA|nr:hypothetical protein C7M84_016169 [Penaeus vannamei]
MTPIKPTRRHHESHSANPTHNSTTQPHTHDTYIHPPARTHTHPHTHIYSSRYTQHTSHSPALNLHTHSTHTLTGTYSPPTHTIRHTARTTWFHVVHTRSHTQSTSPALTHKIGTLTLHTHDTASLSRLTQTHTHTHIIITQTHAKPSASPNTTHTPHNTQHTYSLPTHTQPTSCAHHESHSAALATQHSPTLTTLYSTPTHTHNHTHAHTESHSPALTQHLHPHTSQPYSHHPHPHTYHPPHTHTHTTHTGRKPIASPTQSSPKFSLPLVVPSSHSFISRFPHSLLLPISFSPSFLPRSSSSLHFSLLVVCLPSYRFSFLSDFLLPFFSDTSHLPFLIYPFYYSSCFLSLPSSYSLLQFCLGFLPSSFLSYSSCYSLYLFPSIPLIVINTPFLLSPSRSHSPFPFPFISSSLLLRNYLLFYPSPSSVLALLPSYPPLPSPPVHLLLLALPLPLLPLPSPYSLTPSIPPSNPPSPSLHHYISSPFFRVLSSLCPFSPPPTLFSIPPLAPFPAPLSQTSFLSRTFRLSPLSPFPPS